MSLGLKVEAMAGDHIDNTIARMYDLAQKLDIFVETKFNDWDVWVYPNGGYFVWNFTKDEKGEYYEGPRVREGFVVGGELRDSKPRRSKVPKP